jgi:hypothetical protein
MSSMLETKARVKNPVEHLFDNGQVDDDELTRDLARRAAQSWDAHREDWQAIVNERAIPPRRVQKIAPWPIAIRARVVWERDGVELLDTVATGWTSRIVLVEITDHRWRLRGVWLDAADVRRRAT